MVADLLLAHKWTILISCDIVAWSATFYMFYARYWLESKIRVLISFSISTGLGYTPHVVLGVLNFLERKSIDFFTLFLLSMFLFGITIGKKYIMIIDRKIQAWATKARKTY
ncbi:hypothetical protein B0H99_104247 [Planomicrobium soli]|uniref:Uncharacterized protein n=1 Tax=Planomicrobium soli TaxID=1176648 RepID=A0A2P8H3I9_9BACL|nr:hypothetical protein B0H99_104247 [Planomicrobium soli]